MPSRRPGSSATAPGATATRRGHLRPRLRCRRPLLDVRRHVRFLTDSSSNLVDRVTLSTTGDDNFSNTISELRAKGFNPTDRKYLVWVDADIYCGIAQVYYDDSATTAAGSNASNGNAGVRVPQHWWGSAKLVATVGTVATFTDSGVPLGLDSYCVTAYNSAGESTASNRVWLSVR